MRSPYDTLVRLRERYGPAVKIGMGPFAFVYLLGRDANELILSTRANDFTWRGAFAALIPLEGDTALPVTDGDEHARRRRLVQPAFGIKRLHTYAAVMEQEIDRTVAAWEPGDRVDLHAALKATVRRIAIRSLFGDHLGGRAMELGEHLQAAIDFANLPPVPGRNVNLPGLPYRRAMRSRAKADAIVYREIARRREQPTDEHDLLSALMEARDEDATALTDEELRDQVVSLIAAGYETTSALVAWTLYATLRDPDVEATLRRELDGVFGNDRVVAERLNEARYLHAVVSETLRLHSPAGVSGRIAETNVEFAGCTIPRGAFVVYSAYVTHREPQWWPDPLVFRPERWLGAAGPIEPEPYTFVPFGGGFRRCIGFAMATLEAKIVVAETLRRVRLRLERHDIAAHGLATVAPKGGVPATIIEKLEPVGH